MMGHMAGQGDARSVSARGWATMLIALGLLTVPAVAEAGDLLPVPPANPTGIAQGASAAALFDAGRFAYDAGNLREAQRLLRGLIMRFPNAPEAVKARALNYEIVARKLDRARRSGLGVAPRRDSIVSRSGLGQPALRPGMKSAPEGGARAPQDDLALFAGDRVFFDASSTTLAPRALKVLRAQARWLFANPNFGFEIVGHADEPGSKRANLALSSRRAKAVRDRLIAMGVSPSRLRVRAAGKRERIALCSFPACYAQNRRAVALVRGWTRSSGLKKSGFPKSTASR